MSDQVQFSRLPARVVLVHLHNASDVDMCHKLSNAMENFFALACGMSGQCRLPFFGLILLRSQPQMLLPLQHVKGNFSRIYSALVELKSVAEDFGSWTNDSICENMSIVGLGIHEAITTFERQAQNLLHAAGFWSQLEIIFFTSVSPGAVAQSIRPVIKDLNLHSFQKVQIVQIKDSRACEWLSEELNFLGNDGQSPLADEPSEIGEMIEILHIDSHPLSLQSFFMGWMHDFAADSEHLHIVFSSGLRIRCDVQERILNTQNFSFHQNFVLGCNPQSMKSIMTNGGMKTSAVEIQRLEVIGRVATETICDSLLFGNPLIVRSTTCWKIDWDELEQNQQHFQALCHLLNQQKQSLVMKLNQRDTNKLTPGQYVQGYASSSSTLNPNQPSSPSGHFVLMPSTSCTMLLKSVCVNELLLPVDIPGLGQPTEENLAAVAAAMDKVTVLPGYNPLQMQSGLFESLIAQLAKNFPKNQQNITRKSTAPAAEQKLASNVATSRKRLYDNTSINRLKLSTNHSRGSWSTLDFPTEL